MNTPAEVIAKHKREAAIDAAVRRAWDSRQKGLIPSCGSRLHRLVLPESRLAFNNTVLSRCRINLDEALHSIDHQPSARGWETGVWSADSELLSPDLAAGIRRRKDAENAWRAS